MSFFREMFGKEPVEEQDEEVGVGQNDYVSPDAYAQSAFELNEPEASDEESVNSLLSNYVWKWGQCCVTCVYAPENETSRTYYILSINGQEFVRSNYAENLVAVLSTADPENEYEELLAMHHQAVKIFHWELLARCCPIDAEDLTNEFKRNAQRLRELWD